MRAITLAVLLTSCASKPPGPTVIAPNDPNSSTASAPAAPHLRFDGLYQTKDAKTHASDEALVYNSYLRFYPDGVVVDVSSTGTANQVANWLVRDAGKASQGTYKLSGDAITFVVQIEACDDPNCLIHYDGTVHEGGMLLHSHSDRTDHDATTEYVFVPVPVK